MKRVRRRVRPFYLLAGLLLLPVCATLVRALGDVVRNLGAAGADTSVLWLAGGAALWAILYALLSRPVRAYVLAHELSHALWAFLLGARVGRIRVGAAGGSVQISHSNVWITLAPYFFPFYTALVAAAYALAAALGDPRPWASVWLGMIGLTWSFHLTFTASALAVHQTDLEEYGYLFSLGLIWAMNLLVLGLGIAAVSPVTCREFLAAVAREGGTLWRLLAESSRAIAGLAAGVTQS